MLLRLISLQTFFPYQAGVSAKRRFPNFKTTYIKQVKRTIFIKNTLKYALFFSKLSGPQKFYFKKYGQK